MDIGTGAGQWAIEVAGEYPDAEVIGTDISPVQPWADAPENCRFRVESLLDGLCFDTGSLDLVNCRLYQIYRVNLDGLWLQFPPTIGLRTSERSIESSNLGMDGCKLSTTIMTARWLVWFLEITRCRVLRHWQRYLNRDVSNLLEL